MVALAPAARRPLTVTAAIVLLVVPLLVLIVPIEGADVIPLPVVIAGYLFALLKMVAAVGLWQPRRWAAILGFVVVLLDGLSAVPGVFFADAATLRALAGLGVILSLATLVLLVLPASRQSYR